MFLATKNNTKKAKICLILASQHAQLALIKLLCCILMKLNIISFMNKITSVKLREFFQHIDCTINSSPNE